MEIANVASIGSWRGIAVACGLALGLSILAPSVARADPCKAIPDRGPAPDWLRKGAVITGPVVYVGDGDSLCVDVGPRQAGSARGGGAWVEVRLADFYAPELHAAGGREAKAALAGLVLGRQVSCIAGRRSYDRVVARCRLKGVDLGSLMRGQDIAEGGRGVSTAR